MKIQRNTVRLSGHPRSLCWHAATAMLVLALGLFRFSVPAFADEGDDEFPYAEERRARISLMQGDIMLQRGDDDQWSYASLNIPLRPYDKLWAPEDSRCEIQVSGGTIARLAENTSMDVLSLSQDLVQVDVTYGVVSFRARENRQGSVLEVATPNAAVEAGDAYFRVDVNRDGVTTVVVHEGSVDIESIAGPLRVERGQEVTIVPEDPPRFMITTARLRDSWDRWNEERDRQIASPRSVRYVDNSDPWVADLDLYGSWTTVETYGSVWIPAMRVGWAPYQSGRWLWVEPWGWTWVSYEPWGWGPYHYGRWVHHHRHGWVWAPGTRTAWIPGNARFIYGSSWVAWVPLGYRDRYYYRSAPQTAISLSLSNYGISGAITVVSNVGFLSGSYRDHRVSLRTDPLRAGGRIAAGLPLRPVRASLYPHVDRVVRTSLIPPRYVERAVVHLRSPARTPEGFSERYRAVQNRSTGIQTIRVPAERRTSVAPARTTRAVERQILKRTTVRKPANAYGRGTEKKIEQRTTKNRGLRGTSTTVPRTETTRSTKTRQVIEKRDQPRVYRRDASDDTGPSRGGESGPKKGSTRSERPAIQRDRR